jgi:Flp pilus assembly protein TadD
LIRAAAGIGMPAVACLALWTSLSGCSRIVVLHDALSAEEHCDLGVVYEREGRLDLAGREYRRSLARDASLTRARVNLGNVEAARGRLDRAERCYRRALRDRPEDGDALNNLAVVLVRRNRQLDEAERLALRAVAGGGRDSLYRATLEEVRAARMARGGAR